MRKMNTEIWNAQFVSLPNTQKKLSSKSRRNKKYHPELNIFSLCNSSPEFSVVLLHAKLPFVADGSVWLGHVLANGYTSKLLCSCRNLFGPFVLAVFYPLTFPLHKIRNKVCEHGCLCLSPHQRLQLGVTRNLLCENGLQWGRSCWILWRISGSLTCGIGGFWGCGGGKTASSLQLSQPKSQLEWRKAAKTTHFLPAVDICLSWWDVSCVFFPTKAMYWSASCPG